MASSSSQLLELQLFEMNGTKEVVTIDKLIPQSVPISGSEIETKIIAEGSGEVSTTESKVENDYIMIPVDVLDQYRAKKPKKVGNSRNIRYFHRW